MQKQASMPLSMAVDKKGEGVSCLASQCTKHSSEQSSPGFKKSGADNNFFASPIDEYIRRMSDGSKSYEPKDWRELVVPGRSITDDFQFGQVLGIGSYGLIREAVYIPEARAFKRKHSLDATDSPLPNYLHTSNGTVISLFEGGELESFAVKTLAKSQENVLDVILPNEVLSLVRIQQARNLEDD